MKHARSRPDARACRLCAAPPRSGQPPTRRTRSISTPRTGASRSACARTSRRSTSQQIKALTKRGLLRRRRLPPRHRRLHGPDRRPDRHRHRRLGPAGPAGRVHRKEPFKRGTVGMARSQRPELRQLAVLHHASTGAARSTASTRSVGEVVSGMDVVDKIKKGDQADNGRSTSPTRSIKMQLAADAQMSA